MQKTQQANELLLRLGFGCWWCRLMWLVADWVPDKPKFLVLEVSSRIVFKASWTRRPFFIFPLFNGFQNGSCCQNLKNHQTCKKNVKIFKKGLIQLAINPFNNQFWIPVNLISGTQSFTRMWWLHCCLRAAEQNRRSSRCQLYGNFFGQKIDMYIPNSN